MVITITLGITVMIVLAVTILVTVRVNRFAIKINGGKGGPVKTGSPALLCYTPRSLYPDPHRESTGGAPSDANC